MLRSFPSLAIAPVVLVAMAWNLGSSGGTRLLAQDAPPIPSPIAAPITAPIAAPVPPSSDFANVPESSGGSGGEMVVEETPVGSPMIATPADFAPVPPTLTPGEAKPPGVTVSETQSNARMIEDEAPERVPVYPDDPNSAWWEIDPHYAFERAQREQKPLMLLFTGIWNAQAMALSQEVFSTKSFNDYVKENLVICYLNYPRNPTDAPDVLRHIKEKFKVRGYPNVLFFHPNGEVRRGIRGYRSGRPVDYFNQLVAACYPVLQSISEQKKGMEAKGFRDWSNYLGQPLFARFVARDQTRVMLQDGAGKRWTVAMNELAPDDQKLAESFPAVKKSPPERAQE